MLEYSKCMVFLLVGNDELFFKPDVRLLDLESMIREIR